MNSLNIKCLIFTYDLYLSFLSRSFSFYVPISIQNAWIKIAHFVFLEAFPLTVNGKLDHRSLPTPEDHEGQTECYVAPSNETEEAIAAALVRVLGVDRVSRNVNFFDLGAHSMSIVRVHRHLKQEHGMDLSIVSFYAFPTVALLAAYIAGGSSGDTVAARNEAADRAELRRRARQRRRGGA